MKPKQLAICSAQGGPFNDDLFNIHSTHSRDDCHSHYRILRDELRKKHWECHTPDYYQNKQTQPDACLFVDIPKKPIDTLIQSLFKPKNPIPLFAILSESEIIWQKNLDLKSH